jgi:hypothetical protein
MFYWKANQNTGATSMKQVFDIVEAIHGKVTNCLDEKGLMPASVAVSPCSYRRLIETRSLEGRIGNLIIGCSPLRKMETPFGKVNIVIDEMISDTEVEVVL